MLKEQPIPSLSEFEILDYLEKLKPSWLGPFLPQADAVINNASVDVKGLQIGLGAGIVNAYRDITSQQRYEFARWKWLSPRMPQLGITELDDLQHAAGMSHKSKPEFCRKLKDSCLEFQRIHPLLSNWIRKRSTLIDFVLEGIQPIPESFSGINASLLNSHTLAINLLWQDPEKALKQAEEQMYASLRSAALMALSALTKNCSNWNFDANLMLPIKLKGDIPEPFKANFGKAREIWGSPSDSKCLMVVAETVNAQHLGFWVPVIRGESGQFIPGAPSAYLQFEGSAVFKDDLPNLAGVPGHVDLKWRAYMQTQFQETMFFSLPVMALDQVGPRPIGVLNINVNPPKGEEKLLWRAYHPEYLREAQSRASQFINFSLFSALIRQKLLKMESISIDTQLPDWNDLPGTGPLLLEKKDG